MVNESKKNFDTSVTLSGLRLDNPVVPASGTFGYVSFVYPIFVTTV